MKILTLSILILAKTLAAQFSVTDVMNAVILTGVNSTPIVSVTSASGDNSKCIAQKLPGSTIGFFNYCLNADGSTNIPSYVIRPGLTLAFSQIGSTGTAGVYCMFAMNPTASAVTAGSFGSVPAVGLAYQCSTNKTAGGQTAVVSGTVTWP